MSDGFDDPWMNEPGPEQGQPAEFIDTPTNEPGDQADESLADGTRLGPDEEPAAAEGDE